MNGLEVLVIKYIYVVILLQQSTENLLVWVDACKVKRGDLTGGVCFFSNRSSVVLFGEFIKF